MLIAWQATLEIDFDGLSLLEAQVEFCSCVFGWLSDGDVIVVFDFLRLLEILEMVLESNVEIERIRPVAEAHAQERLLTVVALHTYDKVTRRVFDVFHGDRRVAFNGTRGKVRAGVAILEFDQALISLGYDLQSAGVVRRIELPVGCPMLPCGRLPRWNDVDEDLRFDETYRFVGLLVRARQRRRRRRSHDKRDQCKERVI